MSFIQVDGSGFIQVDGSGFILVSDDTVTTFVVRGWIGSAFAVTPFGASTPASALPTPVVQTLTSAYIDPRSRDNVVQPDGELSMMPRVRQQMLIALMTVIGSMSSNQAFGIDVPKKVDQTLVRRMDKQVRSACKHVVDALITSVDTVVTAMGRVVVTVSYTDLTTGLADQVIA